MRIQVLLQWGFVFIYPALMNMNLHLDREVAVLLWTLHLQLSHPRLPLTPFKVVIGSLGFSKFLESLGL